MPVLRFFGFRSEGSAVLVKLWNFDVYVLDSRHPSLMWLVFSAGGTQCWLRAHLMLVPVVLGLTSPEQSRPYVQCLCDDATVSASLLSVPQDSCKINEEIETARTELHKERREGVSLRIEVSGLRSYSSRAVSSESGRGVCELVVSFTASGLALLSLPGKHQLGTCTPKSLCQCRVFGLLQGSKVLQPLSPSSSTSSWSS